jgi:hypothetical protein
MMIHDTIYSPNSFAVYLRAQEKKFSDPNVLSCQAECHRCRTIKTFSKDLA